MGLQAKLDLTYGLAYTEIKDDLLVSLNNAFGNDVNNPENMMDEDCWDMTKLATDFPNLGVATCYRNPEEAYLVIFTGNFTRLIQSTCEIGSDTFPYHLPQEKVSNQAQAELEEFHRRYPASKNPTWLLLGDYS